MSDHANEIPIEAWNTILFEKFVRFRHIVTNGLAKHGEKALREGPYAPGDHVLDIGCGFGDTTLAIAGQVTTSGRAVGVDCAENFVAIASKEATEAGFRNASYFVADVQGDDLRGPYDHAFARFGTMFFNLPGVAFRNICRALKAGGSLTMVVWRKREDNPWIHEAEQVARAIVPVVAHGDTDQVHCGPGPFSMADADLVSDMLASSGFGDISLRRYDCDICLGADMNEAISAAMELGPAGEIIRLAGAEGERLRPAVADALRSHFAPLCRQDGSVWGVSSSWIVRCRRMD